jgi:hypothetical protein
VNKGERGEMKEQNRPEKKLRRKIYREKALLLRPWLRKRIWIERRQF